MPTPLKIITVDIKMAKLPPPKINKRLPVPQSYGLMTNMILSHQQRKVPTLRTAEATIQSPHVTAETGET